MPRRRVKVAPSAHYLEPEDLSVPVNWSDFFGSDQPVELDIGCGKGLFVANAARRWPDRNFLGIEIARKYARRAADRAAKLKLSNARILGGDAKTFLGNAVATGSVHAVHVYFPDPWWKARHRKRRVFDDPFVDEVTRILEPGGHLWIVTDVLEYFGVMTGLMAQRPLHFTELPRPAANDPQHDLDFLTNFERKFRHEGRPIYRAHYRSRETPPL